MGGVRGDLAAQMTQHGNAAGVEAGGDHDSADGPGQFGDRALEALGHVVGVGAGPDDVIAARAEAHQIGGEFLGARYLLLDDLVEEASAYGEIGVPEIPVSRTGGSIGSAGVRRRIGVGELVREKYREAVRPADEGSVRTQVTDSLGEAVANRCVRPDRAIPVTDATLIFSRIVCHKGTSCTAECDLRDRNKGLTGGDIDHPVRFW